MSTITREQLDNWFSYHPPSDAQQKAYRDIRAGARHFAGIIVASTPSGEDQQAAIRKLREVVMTANAAVACSEEEHVG